MTRPSDSLTATEDAPLLVSGPGCPNCGEPGEDVESSWCRKCGYYGKLGAQIEIDANYEQLATGDEQPAQTVWEAIPPWAWRMGAIWLALFGVSVTARILLADSPDWHSLWGVGQLAIGAMTVIALHTLFFFRRAMANDGAQLMDLLNPYAVWAPVFQAMPRTERLILTGWSGAWAAAFSLCIVGGLRSEWFEFEHTPVAKKKKDKPKGPTVAGGGGDGSLTDAIEQFAEQGAGGLGAPQVGPQPLTDDEPEVGEETEEAEEVEEELQQVECVIVGFAARTPAPDKAPDAAEGDGAAPQSPADDAAPSSAAKDAAEPDAATPANETGELPSIRGLILASRVSGRLMIVGTVTEGLTPEVCDRLLPQLREQTRDTPFLPCKWTAEWVEPVFVCRIRFKQWSPKVGLVEPQFDALLQVVAPNR